MAIHHGPAFRLARESARIFGRADEISRKTTFFERHLETPSGMSDLKPASGRAIRRQIEWTPACVLLVVLRTLTLARYTCTSVSDCRRSTSCCWERGYSRGCRLFHRVLEADLASRRRDLHHGVTDRLAARRHAVVPAGLRRRSRTTVSHCDVVLSLSESASATSHVSFGSIARVRSRLPSGSARSLDE